MGVDPVKRTKIPAWTIINGQAMLKDGLLRYEVNTQEMASVGPWSIIELPDEPEGTMCIVEDVGGQASLKPIGVKFPSSLGLASVLLIEDDYGSFCFAKSKPYWTLIRRSTGWEGLAKLVEECAK